MQSRQAEPNPGHVGPRQVPDSCIVQLRRNARAARVTRSSAAGAIGGVHVRPTASKQKGRQARREKAGPRIVSSLIRCINRAGLGALGAAFAMVVVVAVVCRRGMPPWWKAAPVLAGGHALSAVGGTAMGQVCALMEHMPGFARLIWGEKIQGSKGQCLGSGRFMNPLQIHQANGVAYKQDQIQHSCGTGSVWHLPLGF